MTFDGGAAVSLLPPMKCEGRSNFAAYEEGWPFEWPFGGAVAPLDVAMLETSPMQILESGRRQVCVSFSRLEVYYAAAEGRRKEDLGSSVVEWSCDLG